MLGSWFGFAAGGESKELILDILGVDSIVGGK
jgi:hypothetical protein